MGKYYVAPTHCNCHPETCPHKPWAIYDSEDDERYDTFFHKEDAEERLAEMDSVERLLALTEESTLLLKEMKALKRKYNLALEFIIEVKNKGDNQSGRWCSNKATDLYEKIMKVK